ncbi:MAG: hypothetical protein LBH20_10330, partial [Treponema sp.]|nr:hypothetical protein [Treponema sp.]
MDDRKKSRTASPEKITQAEKKVKAEPARAVQPAQNKKKTAPKAPEDAPVRKPVKKQPESHADAAKTGGVDNPLSDPAVIKLIEYAKGKKTLSIEELSDYLPDYISDTEKIEPVLALLESNNVQIIVDDGSGEEEGDADSA